MVGGCAPRLAEDVGMGPDEAVSLTGTVAPRLDRRGSSASAPPPARPEELDRPLPHLDIVLHPKVIANIESLPFLMSE